MFGRKYILLLVLGVLIFSGCATTRIPEPRGMGTAPGFCAAPEDVLDYFAGTKYWADGALNSNGEFTFFADQKRIAEKPGLNCSGFVVAASRYLFKRNYALNDTIIDRLADSGPDSPYGEDWDFGYDLILNVTEGQKRKVVLPFGQSAQIVGSNGMDLRGFRLHDREAWADVIAQMKPGKAYLFSMSKPIKFKNYTLLHYHVGLIVPDGKGHVWFTHATRNSGVVKIDVSNPANLEPIIMANPDSELGPRKILIVEASL